jgi:hypothetical protein
MAWPKGKSRKPKPEEARPDSDSEPACKKPQQSKAKDDVRKPWTLKERLKAKAKDVEWEDRSEQVSTHIDPELVANLRREGIVLQWCTETVLGKEFPERMSQFERNGWERLSQRSWNRGRAG